MKPTIWHGCYDKSLKGFITDQSFGHPAKYSLGLIERIFDHCLQRGYLDRGDVVGDCFGGVCIGGLVAAYRGLEWQGVELEPRFVQWCEDNIALHRSKFKALGVTPPRITQGDSRAFHVLIGGTDAMVSSPPYLQTGGADERTKGGFKSHPSIDRMSNGSSASNYGQSPGQIGRLKSGAVDGVIASPPYSETLAHGGGPDTKQDLLQGGKSLLAIKVGYGETEGNIGSCRAGEVSAVVSSPPYAVISTGAGGLNTKPAKHEGQQSGRNAKAASQDTDRKYGMAEGQIARLKNGDVQAVVTSPPWESNSEGGVKASKFNYTLADTKGHGSTPAAKKRAMERDEQKVYGDSEGQIGKEKGETYWQAMDQVYRSCFQAIKPGGVIALVVKDYCKGGKRVRLCDDTMRLLEHIGFQPLERIHAMLVSETVEAGLFGEERTKRQRKSFFRRLYEAGIPEGDERRIDHEEVLIARKPL